MKPDQRVARLAAPQYGLYTTGQAHAAGITAAGLAWRSSSGRIERLEPNVYRLAGVPATWHQWVFAACFTEDALAYGRTAAALWDLDGFSPRIVKVVTPRWKRRVNRSVRVHESGDLSAEDRAEQAGVPVTAIERTLIDLGASAPRRRVEQAFDDALRRGLTTPELVRDRFVEVARRGRRGIGVLRPMSELRLGTTGPRPGEFERRMWRLLVDAGVAEPVLEYEVRLASGLFVARIDLAYPQLRFALEIAA
ncbi:MAG: type IV toxin-antitoxin system AbiEi family antitoxin domain-containing protein [Acidimicrobiales bacterium]